MDEPAATQAFLSRWSGTDSSELANYQLFLTELIELLDLPRPEPAGAEAAAARRRAHAGINPRSHSGTAAR
jgi:hypothetical protein